VEARAAVGGATEAECRGAVVRVENKRSLRLLRARSVSIVHVAVVTVNLTLSPRGRVRDQ